VLIQEAMARVRQILSQSPMKKYPRRDIGSMCRMLAVVAVPSDTKFTYDSLMRLFDLSGEYRHGWGVGYFTEDRAVVEREPVQGNRSALARAAALRARSPTVIGHIRKGSVGDRSLENTHPFTDGHWIFCHNGTIDIHAMLRASLTDKRSTRLIGSTDSEVFFQWLLQNMEEQGDPIGGMEEALHFILRKKGKGTTSLNFLLSDGTITFACNLSFERHDYFCLHYKRGAGIDGNDRSPLQICSQPLGEIDGWEPVDDATLTIIREGTKMSFQSID
jgi:predicted glutamine amidotransferase